MSPPLLQVRGLVKRFPVRRGLLRRAVGAVEAVRGVSFDIGGGRTLGLVGESGCGKTTTGRCVLRLLEPDGGSIVFDGQEITRLREARLRPLRRRMQVVFQDPFASLNPRMSVGQALAEPLAVHGIARGRAARDVVAAALERVGLSADHAARYPHDFSGGQRQRIGIARALVLDPRFVVCDEVVSALDVSVQAQILNLLADLQRDRGLAYLFISHDLAVVRHVSHEVAVMLAGRLVERASVDVLFADPLHPYTRELLAAVPGPGRRAEAGAAGGVDVAGTGCPFHPRCPETEERCRVDPPPALRRVAPGHRVACWLVSD